MSKEAIDKGHHDWLKAMQTNDAQALGPLVAGDVVLMPPHQNAVSGPQEVVNWFAAAVQHARTVAVDVTEREVMVSGDLGIERGAFTWRVAPAAGGPQVEDRGHFLAIWRRQSDGAWKITRNIWNSTLPVAARTAEA